MAYRTRASKTDRPLYLTDRTVTLWRDTVRRERVLWPAHATADDVLRRACELLRRAQEHQAGRLGVDLTPPARSDDPPAPDSGYDGPPGSAAY